MATLTVRVGQESYRMLKELSQQTGEPMPVVLARATQEYRRQRFLEGLADDFAALRADPEAWREEEAERATSDIALADNLEEV